MLIAPSLQAEPFRLNSTLSAPLGTPARDGFLDQVVTEMLHRVGYTPLFEFLHEERGLQALNQGLDDGNLPRVAGLEALYPNIRQVPGAVMEFHFQLFSQDPNIEISGWSNLKNYAVAYVTGWKILEQNVHALSVTTVATSQQLFELLAQGRTQLIIYEKWQGLELVEQNGWQHQIHALEPPLITKDVFLYVHKSFEPLVPRLAKALKAMKQDGNYDSIKERTLGRYITP